MPEDFNPQGECPLGQGRETMPVQALVHLRVLPVVRHPGFIPPEFGLALTRRFSAHGPAHMLPGRGTERHSKVLGEATE